MSLEETVTKQEIFKILEENRYVALGPSRKIESYGNSREEAKRRAIIAGVSAPWVLLSSQHDKMDYSADCNNYEANFF